MSLSRVFARRPLLAFVCTVGVGAFGLLAALRGVGAAPEADTVENSGGRSILNRFWFERWPEAPSTRSHYLLFLAGGMGLHEEGASYKFAIELFEFERKGERIEAKFLDDGERKNIDFKIEPCSERPPFDLCLRWNDEFRGPRTYYTFASEDELAERAPWLRGEYELARARAARRP